MRNLARTCYLTERKTDRTCPRRDIASNVLCCTTRNTLILKAFSRCRIGIYGSQGQPMSRLVQASIDSCFMGLVGV